MNSLKFYKAALISLSFTLIFSYQNTLHVFGNPTIKLEDLTLRADLVVQGLKSPTSMAFLAEGHILVLEKNGIVKRIFGNSILEHPLLNITSIVNSTLERGLLGIAIPEESIFSEYGSHVPNSNISEIYLYFTEKVPNYIHNLCNAENCTTPRVVNSLYAYEMKQGQLVNPRQIFSIPFEKGDIGNQHIGGKITIGPDKRI